MRYTTQRHQASRLEKYPLFVWVLAVLLSSCSQETLPNNSDIASLKLVVTFPDSEMEELSTNRSESNTFYHLRGVAEFYPVKQNKPVKRVVTPLAPTDAQGIYTFTTEMPVGKYDVTLWVDYVENDSNIDLWYDTSYLQFVQMRSNNKCYLLNQDSRQAFYGNKRFSTSDSTILITCHCPHAKYQIITEDITRYKELMISHPQKYPPLENVNISVNYDVFLLDAIQARTGQPNGAQPGYYGYHNQLQCGDDTEAILCYDYLFAIDETTPITLTLTITDRKGNLVSQKQGIKLPCKRNRLTTLRGNFLTMGNGQPDINIDTNWEGSFDVNF